MVEQDIQPNFYTVIGVEPEVLAYALAKFSRSANTLTETLKELSGEKAEKFFNTFYFQYGHNSIADLLHVVLSLENIPIIEAIEVWDDPLIDGQESSTRYQNFSRRRFATPQRLVGLPMELYYKNMGNKLFETYFQLQEPVSKYLLEKYGPSRPADIDEGTALRTANARTFDRTRYLLPSSTYTNMGIIMSARTAEKMIIRLVSNPNPEIQNLGAKIRETVKDHPAFNLVYEKQKQLFLDQEDFGPRQEFYQQALDLALGDVKSAPTLVKYTNPSQYQQMMYARLKDAAKQYLGDEEPENGRLARLHFNIHPEIEAAATALYKGSNHSFQQALEVAEGMEYGERRDLTDSLFEGRGAKDETVREANTGRMLIFDIETDNGAFRDLIRHRNMVKIIQDFTPNLGFDTPEDFKAAGLDCQYKQVMESAGILATALDSELLGVGQYILPLAYRRKMLMKMDSAQLQYIVENRTTTQGHFSYRETAYKMWQQAMQYIPDLAKHIRVTHPSVENFWKR
ncbi:FAD-dependent thymidylate synthase [Candidatus Daviesbacteria bacterium]|nr:FAD-dependent thymidylate synthase [Candidatus Daviesbacteria bacterium]